MQPLTLLTGALSALLVHPQSPWSDAVKTYRPWNVEQAYLLPPSPSDWLDEGHLAYFVLDIVKELDLSAISRAINGKDARGEKPYSPVMMVALVLYAYSVGVFSSRRIERATYEDIAFRVITGGQHPDHTRISDFRRVHIEAFAGLFKQTVQLCQEAGLVKLGIVAIDGTKVQGNASKHKAMSYERMQEKEKRLEQESAELLARAEQTDQAEDERFGEGQREEDLPAELRRREGRLEKIRAAKRALEAQAARTRIAELEEQAARNEETATTHPDATERKRAATRAKKRQEQAKELSDSRSDDDNDDNPTSGGPTSQGLETHQTPATPEGTPRPKAQHNFTDPDSRIQESGGAFLQGYNAQAMVDAESQVVVAQAVTNLQPDNSHLQPMLEQTQDNCSALPEVALGDAGYWKPDNAAAAEELGVDLYVSTKRRKHGTAPPDSPEPYPVAADDARAQMTAKLQTNEGRAHYARRKAIVEPVFGQIKECRGFRRFLLRGLPKVIGEWSLVTATHNLLKFYRAQTAA